VINDVVTRRSDDSRHIAIVGIVSSANMSRDPPDRQRGRLDGRTTVRRFVSRVTV
jgi:hypothetical protein